MGASLHVAAMRWPLGRDGEPAPIGAGLVATLQRRWGALDADAKATVLDASDRLDAEVTPVRYLAAWSALTVEVYEVLCDVFGEGSRGDCAELVCDTTVWVVTGGMSGSDAPTDAYDAVRAIAWAQLCEVPV